MISHSYSYLLSHSLAWALLHSLWQGAIVFGLLFAVLKALDGLSARVKYVLSFTSLAVVVGWFVSTWVGQFRQLFNVAEIASQQLISSPAHINIGGGNVVRMAAIGPESVFSLRSWLEHNAGVIMLFYSIGFVFMSLRVIVNFAGVRRIRTKFISLPGDDLLELLHNGIARLGISLPVQLRLSSKVTVPMMVGALKPMILVPLATVNQLTTPEMEAILLHELAHVKRHDYLLNFFQVAIETILFFNPFVWLLSAIIRREREHACDDVVVGHIQNPLPYAKALAAIESCRLQSNNLSLAANGKHPLLFLRIRRIMGQRKDAFSYSQLALCIAILSIMFATITTSVVSSLAQKVKKPVRQSANRGVDIQSADSNIRDSAEAKGGSIAVTAEVAKQNLLDTVTRGRVSQNQFLAVALASGYGRNGSDSLYYRNLDKLLRGNDTVVDLDHAPDSHPTEFNEELATASKELLGVEGWEGLRQGLEKFINSPHVSSSNSSMIPKMRVELEQFEDKVKTADSRIKYNKHFASMLMSIEMARVTLISEGITYDMLNKMVNDALIQRKGTYIIEKKDDELFINGTRQADDVLKKYMIYLKAKNVSITERDFAIKSYHSENLHSSYTSEITEPPYR